MKAGDKVMVISDNHGTNKKWFKKSGVSIGDVYILDKIEGSFIRLKENDYIYHIGDFEVLWNLLDEVGEQFYNKHLGTKGAYAVPLRTFPTGSVRDNDDNHSLRRFPSGAVRSNDAGRMDPTLISPYALEALALHLTTNENLFDKKNYWLGIPEGECMKSLQRHYIGYVQHDYEGDSEKAYVDLVSIAFNAIAALHTAEIKKRGIYTEPYANTEII